MKQLSTLMLAAMALSACGGTKQPSSADQPPATTVADNPPQVTVPPETVFVTAVPRPAPRRAPPPPEPAPAPPPVDRRTGQGPQPPREHGVLDAGTEIRTTLNDPIHSGYNGPGDPIHATVNNDILDNGRVVIPAGSVITFRVSAIGPATSRGEKGTLGLDAESVRINGREYPISGTGTDYDFEMRARAVNAGDVATAAGGAGIGAIIGHVIGGKTGTIIGAIGGGAAGTAVAAKNADRDIIVHPGTPLTLALLNPFER